MPRMFSMYGAYALGFFQGTRQVARRESELSDVLTTLLAIIIGGWSRVPYPFRNILTKPSQRSP